MKIFKVRQWRGADFPGNRHALAARRIDAKKLVYVNLSGAVDAAQEKCGEKEGGKTEEPLPDENTAETKQCNDCRRQPSALISMATQGHADSVSVALRGHACKSGHGPERHRSPTYKTRQPEPVHKTRQRKRKGVAYLPYFTRN